MLIITNFSSLKGEHMSRRTSPALLAGSILTISIAALAGGCASYAAPGRAADMTAMGIRHDLREVSTDPTVRDEFNRKPLASFPASIAFVRVQAPQYRSSTAESWGHGRYSIITTRDVEKDEHIQRLAQMPMVRQVGPISRLLLSPQLDDHKQLRDAAAMMQADMLLIYTLDTTFYVRDMATPLTVVSLGLSPNREARVVTTASAVLMDTRNGYIYGLAEASARRNQLAAAWTSGNAIDQSRIKTEQEAFDKLVGELETMWARVLQGHLPSGVQRAAQSD